jgi:hypothetical protein
MLVVADGVAVFPGSRFASAIPLPFFRRLAAGPFVMISIPAARRTG